jgi:hypothetical protein
MIQFEMSHTVSRAWVYAKTSNSGTATGGGGEECHVQQCVNSYD